MGAELSAHTAAAIARVFFPPGDGCPIQLRLGGLRLAEIHLTCGQMVNAGYLTGYQICLSP
jgi:hypothetical protein